MVMMNELLMTMMVRDLLKRKEIRGDTFCFFFWASVNDAGAHSFILLIM